MNSLDEARIWPINREWAETHIGLSNRIVTLQTVLAYVYFVGLAAVLRCLGAF